MNSYWRSTRSPLYSFLFTIPLFFIYEIGIFLTSSDDMFVLQMDSFKIEGTLGIGDNEINNFEYFYNVSSKTLEMTSDETLRKIQVFNILGQKVFEENINSNVHTSNLGDLGASIYIINVEGTTGVRTFKLLVQ